MAIVVTGYFMLVVDMSIVSVALPAISRGLSFSAASLSWITTAYTLSYAGFLMFGGRLADLYGRRRIFLGGLALFTGASLAAAFSPDAGALVAARFVQGFGAAMAAPSALALIMDLYPEGPRRRRALGAFQSVAGSGGAFGLLLGGLLTSWFGWEAIFLVNLPIGLVIVGLGLRFLPRAAPGAHGRRFDLAGAATITAALALLIYTAAETAQRGWLTVPTLGGLAGAVALLVLFGLIEHRSADPLLPLRIPRNPVVRRANLRGLLLAGAFLSAFTFIALDDEEVLGHSPARSGLALLPVALMIVLVGRIGPRLVARFGIRPLALMAPVVTAAGLFWLAASSSSDFLTMRLMPELLIGFGAAVGFLVNMLAATNGAEPHERGVVSALQSTAQQVGISVGLATFVSLAAARATHLVATHQAAGTVALHDGFRLAFLAGGIAALASAALAIEPGRRVAHHAA